jgi:hypothetical protein
MTRQTGLKNRRPRRGSGVDAWLRKQNLRRQITSLPRKKQLPWLEEEAMTEMRRAMAEMGVQWGEG